MNVITLMELAHDILTTNDERFRTPYMDARSQISNFFKQTTHNDVYLRLVIIDSLYSTQMSKKMFGLDHLSSAIKSLGDDECLKEKAMFFLQERENDSCIKNLLNGKYGRSKTDEDGIAAGSLISKYLYFLMDYRFPIIDSFVKNYVLTMFSASQSVRNYLKGLSSRTKKVHENEKLIELLININKEFSESKITYEKMDNLLWLTGKVKKGAMSLIVQESHYDEIEREIRTPAFNKKLEQTKKGDKSDLIDDLFSEKLSEADTINKLRERRYISKDLSKFLNEIKDIDKIE